MCTSEKQKSVLKILKCFTKHEKKITKLFDYYSITASETSIRQYKKSYKNNKFKISGPTWNDKSKLPDGSYSAPNI